METATEGDALVLRSSLRIHTLRSEDCADFLRQAVSGSIRRIVFALDDHTDSAAVALLIALRRALPENTAMPAMENMPPEVSGLLHLYGLENGILTT